MKEKLSALPDTFKQLIKYGLVGVLNAGLYFGINFLLIEFFDYFRQHLITASLIAGVISFANSLYFNRKWTFKSKTHWLRDTLYIVFIWGICTILQNIAYAQALYFFRSVQNLQEKEILFYSQLAGVVVFATLNFTLNKFVTFRKKKGKNDEPGTEDQD